MHRETGEAYHVCWEAERRQLTVMFCDLVGSTALSTAIDPEDLRDVIASFQTRCSAAIRRYDGFVAKYMGDGILAYFGYPRAHENDPERSVRAGLDIVEAMVELNATVPRPPGVELVVRIGIATGPVIVGDQIGEGTASETAVVGETPNLAARLQALAQPNQIVVSSATRMMLGDHFDLEDLGAYELKGFAEPVPVWRVLSARDVESRFAATRTGSSAPLVGRQEEMGLLLRAWDGSCRGRGQVVLIQGEAGVGKSRLVEGLSSTLAIFDSLVLIHGAWPVTRQGHCSGCRCRWRRGRSRWRSAGLGRRALDRCAATPACRARPHLSAHDRPAR